MAIVVGTCILLDVAINDLTFGPKKASAYSNIPAEGSGTDKCIF